MNGRRIAQVGNVHQPRDTVEKEVGGSGQALAGSEEDSPVWWLHVSSGMALLLSWWRLSMAWTDIIGDSTGPVQPGLNVCLEPHRSLPWEQVAKKLSPIHPSTIIQCSLPGIIPWSERCWMERETWSNSPRDPIRAEQRDGNQTLR